jgi:hypothetical protein
MLHWSIVAGNVLMGVMAGCGSPDTCLLSLAGQVASCVLFHRC